MTHYKLGQPIKAVHPRDKMPITEAVNNPNFSPYKKLISTNEPSLPPHPNKKVILTEMKV